MLLTSKKIKIIYYSSKLVVNAIVIPYWEYLFEALKVCFECHHMISVKIKVLLGFSKTSNKLILKSKESSSACQPTLQKIIYVFYVRNHMVW